MMNEWGLAQAAPAPTPPSPAAYTLIGGGLGVVLGGAAGAMTKHTALGAVAGALVGAGGGYYLASRAPAGTAAPSSSAPPAGTPGTSSLPPGPYTRVAADSSGSIPIKVGETYIASIPVNAGEDLNTAFNEAASEISGGGAMTLLGVWTGFPPAGWPANDPNAAGGVFIAFKNTSNTADSFKSSTTVYATGGATS